MFPQRERLNKLRFFSMENKKKYGEIGEENAEIVKGIEKVSRE